MSVEQVRALIPDVNTPYVFSEQEIETYLSIAGDNVLRAAAFAIEANASVLAENYISVRTDDLAVNGAPTVEALLKRAKALRDEADRAEAAGAADFFTLVFPRECDRCPEFAECRSCRW